MRHACYTLYIIIATFVLIGCGGKSEFRQTLEALDSVLVSCPDSVYDVLNKLEPQKQSEADRMYYELLRADAQNKAYIDFTTDSVMKIVADYYDHNGNANEQMRAHYLLGCTYRDLQDVPMELQCFQEAVEKADTTKMDCDLYTLVAIYGQMADIYYSQLLPDEELKALDLCEKIAKQDKDTLTAIKSYALKIRPYFFKDMKDSVLSVTKNAYQRFIQTGSRQSAARILGTAISIYIERKDFDSAKEYMELFENESGYIDNEGNISPKAILYLHSKGLLALHNNQTDSAKVCFSKLLELKEKESGYQGLLLLYEQTHQYDSIAKYAKLYAAINDSTILANNANIIEQMTASYNYGRHKYAAQQKTKIAANLQKTLLIYIFISLLIVGTIVFITFKIKKNKDVKIEVMTKSYFEALATKEQIEKEMSQLQISVNNQANNAKVEEVLKKLQKQYLQEMHKLEKQKEMAQYQIDFYSGKLDINDNSKRLEAFMHTDIYKKMKQTIAFRNEEMKFNNKDWEEFMRLYKQYFTTYYNFINSAPHLNPDERILCLLVRLGFTPTELAGIMNKKSSRISNIRTAINKKLFDKEGATNIENNLKKFF